MAPKTPEGWKVVEPEKEKIPSGWRAVAPRAFDINDNLKALNERSVGKPKEVSETMSALAGYGQGASFGFSDELNGAVHQGVQSVASGGVGALKTTAGRALMRRVHPSLAGLPDAAIDAVVDHSGDEAAEAVLGAKPRSRGGTGLPGAGYAAGRDQMRQDNEDAEAANPGTYLAANVVGGMMAPGPKAGPMKIGGATLKPWAGRAVTGTGLGSLTGLGMSKGETVGEVAGDTLLGGAFGGVAAPVLGAATDKAGSSFAQWLQNRSRQNALKAMGLNAGISNKAARLGYENADDLLAFGAKVRDEGDIIRPFRTPADVEKMVGPALSEAGAAKGSALDELTDMALAQGKGFDFNAAGQDMHLAAVPKQGWDPIAREAAADAFKNAGQVMAGDPAGGFKMADQMRANLGKNIKWNAPAFGQSTDLSLSMERKGYGALSEAIDKQARDIEARASMASGRIPGPDDLGASDQLAAMNKRMSTLMDVKALATDEAQRDLGRGSMGLKDWMAGAGMSGAVGMAGSPALAAVAMPLIAGVSKEARNRLPSALTYAQNAASKALPSFAAAAEPKLIQATTGTAAVEAQHNAFEALAKRFGINAKSKEELANEAFVRGQTGSGSQP
jgi:hypothetical protein